MDPSPVARSGSSTLTEELPPEPQSASRARRMVAAALEEAGFDSYVEVATLLVSEAVTNAVLHAGTPIRLDCSYSEQCVRIEVHDGSAIMPGVRHYDAEATTGRGLALVAALADRWGVEGTDRGKTLWFELGQAGERGDDGVHPAEGATSTVTIRLLDAPPTLILATVEYGDAVLRELALLSLGGELEDEMPGGWQQPQFDLGPVLAAASEARDAGSGRASLVLELPDDVRETSLHRLRLIDCADGIARKGGLLVQPALPEVAACRHWIYSQIHEQSLGAPPEPWRLPDPVEPARVAAVLSPSELASLEAATVATLVADDANRIIYVNGAGDELLGWDHGGLLGQRLTVVIPPELREAHLAGFSRLQLTGESRLLGRPVEVPALRRDGTTVAITLTINAVPSRDRRRAYRASLAPRSGGEAGGDTGG